MGGKTQTGTTEKETTLIKKNKKQILGIKDTYIYQTSMRLVFWITDLKPATLL